MPVRDVVLRGDVRAPSRRPPRYVAVPDTTPGRRPARVLVIGDAAAARRLIDDLHAESDGRAPWLVGVVSLDELSRLEHTIGLEQPDRVILLDPACSRERLDTILEVSRRRHMRLQVLAEHLGDDTVAVLPGAEPPVYAVHASTQSRGRYRIKRILDVLVAGALLVVLSPFFAVVAVLTRLGSPGPVFYVSWRVGVGETPFPCYKFRTMCVGADVQQEELESRNEADGCLFKIRDDPRVTRTGRFLRRTSFDELPQLVNVLLGHMSLVGPRPLPVRDVERMDPRYKRRHAVLPGMTGLWQVSGRSSLRADTMMALDLEYVRTWSLGADLRILWRTIGVCIRGKGAY